MARKESGEFTLFGDLEGITVARLREMLDDYPLDAVIDVRSERGLSGGWTDQDREFFVFTWEE
jgi:hypothetical protein